MGDPRLALASGALVLSAASPHAWAQVPSGATKAHAQQLAKQAAAKSQAGDHDDAIDLYNQAYMIVPVPVLLSNIGAEYQLENKPADAVRYFCRYLKADPQGAAVNYATEQVKALQGTLGNTVDDNDVCTVKPPPPPPPAPAPAPAPASTPPHVELPSAAANDREAPTTALGDTRGEPVDRTNHALEYAGIGVASAGTIALGVGVYYLVQGKNLSDAISSHQPGTPWPMSLDGVPISQWGSAGHSDNVNAAAFSIAGGVAIAGGAVMFMLGRPKPGDTHIAISPIATGSTWGLSVSGGW